LTQWHSINEIIIIIILYKTEHLLQARPYMNRTASSSGTSAADTDVIWTCWNGKYGVRLIACRRL